MLWGVVVSQTEVAFRFSNVCSAVFPSVFILSWCSFFTSIFSHACVFFCLKSARSFFFLFLPFSLFFLPRTTFHACRLPSSPLHWLQFLFVFFCDCRLSPLCAFSDEAQRRRTRSAVACRDSRGSGGSFGFRLRGLSYFYFFACFLAFSSAVASWQSSKAQTFLPPGLFPPFRFSLFATNCASCECHLLFSSFFCASFSFFFSLPRVSLRRSGPSVGFDRLFPSATEPCSFKSALGEIAFLLDSEISAFLLSVNEAEGDGQGRKTRER
ncbi:putative transmembrane protein [Toxoplasma gondii VAND]|uniref:Putative transmembrane protein n=1 Tax=Toxoplasma gondii VAND TaxID=933077 RepID=A0A086PYX3_TOXGO|nr:putative transmembrane protein [Toxoplasma gondii VAND]